ncbi:MAG: exo-alpha-sialidase, partial [Lentisphaeria bacterium]|nr:exo-alpha-sialidase [Lentisphaeria bacterium]
MKIEVGKELLIVQGMTPEEDPWGAYQFPHPYRLADGRIAVAVHVSADDIKSFGNTNRWFVSSDNGESFSEADPSIDAECGTLLANGDRLYFPPESGFSVSNYKEPPFAMRTPGYDTSKRAEEGTLPLPDGITAWWGGSTTIKAYNADRLPPSLAAKVWRAKLIKAGADTPEEIFVNVNWPYLTRVVFSSKEFDNILKPIFPRGPVKRGPDGALWLSTYSGEGHLNPKNGQYSPYYSAEMFRSDDEGMNWTLHAHMEYPADGDEYPYLSGGFSDSDFEFMPDVSMVWFFRSAWYGSTTWEWAPMYMSRSNDMGRTWSKPAVFAHTGILPRL